MVEGDLQGTSLAGDIEGFGISFLEAGACGKPVVGGRSGGAVEAIVDRETWDAVQKTLTRPDKPRRRSRTNGALLAG